MKQAIDLIKKKKKVYCNDCRFLEKKQGEYKCSGYKKDTWLAEGNSLENPKKKNKYNDCPRFEKEVI